jgi:hypothetical protein
MKEVVVRVVYVPGDGTAAIGLVGDARRSHHLTGEAPSAAVCLALEVAARQVARCEVSSGDGFSLRVVFVNESGEPIAPKEDVREKLVAAAERVDRALYHEHRARNGERYGEGGCYGWYEVCGEHHVHDDKCGARPLICCRRESGPELAALHAALAEVKP